MTEALSIEIEPIKNPKNESKDGWTIPCYFVDFPFCVSHEKSYYIPIKMYYISIKLTVRPW